MFTDMVGYTALGQRNESLSLDLVNEQRKLIRPVLARHSGREVKTMGDAFLVEFPSALDAVRCAYDIQRSIREFNISVPDERKLHLRIGVHLGDVVESSGDISGDAVNLASRIQPLAEDGGVCITRQVYDHVRNKFELGLSTMGMRPLKGVSIPVEVFRMEMPWSAAPREASSDSLDKQRIAVLPFTNMSPDPNDEYFSDGLTEELISRISTVAGLQVISRTSAMHYKKNTHTTREIAEELRSGSILEGSVRKAGDKVRVTVQLIDGNTDTHVWAETYDRQLQDVFAIQGEIAGSVVDSLRVKLFPKELARIQTQETSSVAAYVAYLKGRSLLREGTEDAAHQAKVQFELAVREDPNYAKAYAGLADAVMLLGDYLFSPVPESMGEASKYVEKALALDPDLAEARVSRANILMFDYRFAEAEKEFRKAIETNPSYATGHHWLATCLQTLGRPEEGIDEILKAERLDPLSPAISLSIIYRMTNLGRRDEALKRVRKLEEVDPNSPLLNEAWMVYYFSGEDWEKAGLYLGKMIEKDPTDPYLVADLAYLDAVTGKRDEALKLVEKLKQVPEGSRIKGNLLAFAYVGLGDLDSAFEWLSYSTAHKETDVGWFRATPYFAPVRADPRFADILRQIGLSQKSD